MRGRKSGFGLSKGSKIGIIGVILVLLIIGLIYYFYSKNKADSSVPVTTTAAPVVGADSSVPVTTTAAPVLGADSSVPVTTTAAPVVGADSSVPVTTTAAPVVGADSSVPVTTTAAPVVGAGSSVPVTTTAAPVVGAGSSVPVTTTAAPVVGADSSVPVTTTTAPVVGAGSSVPVTKIYKQSFSGYEGPVKWNCPGAENVLNSGTDCTFTTLNDAMKYCENNPVCRGFTELTNPNDNTKTYRITSSSHITPKDRNTRFYRKTDANRYLENYDQLGGPTRWDCPDAKNVMTLPGLSKGEYCNFPTEGDAIEFCNATPECKGFSELKRAQRYQADKDGTQPIRNNEWDYFKKP